MQPLKLIVALAAAAGVACGSAAPKGTPSNRLSSNGLSSDGLSSPAFASWFSANPIFSDMVMRYTVECAVAANDSRSYTDPTSGVTYRWRGELGLAPTWSAGSPIPSVEQQLVSACLAAHANKFGSHDAITVRGQSTNRS